MPSFFRSHQANGFLICVGAAFFALTLILFGALDGLELKSVDHRFMMRGTRPELPDIVVVTIDEESIGELGRWPWPRRYHGRVVESLTAAGAKAIAFDSIFSEPDKSDPASDQAFADAVARSGRVVVPIHFRGDIDQHLFAKDPSLPYPALAEHAYKGFVNFEPDPDGVSRHAYLYAIEGDSVYPSLSVAAFALAQGKTFEEVLPLLPVVVSRDPLLARNQVFINYAFHPDRYPYQTYSYADVLRGRTPAATFKGKIVLVGATAAALGDVKVVPFISKYPGVMIHANVLDNLLQGAYMRVAPAGTGSILVLLVCLILGFLLPRLSTWAKLGAFGGTSLLLIAASVFLFSTRGLIVPLVAPLLASVCCYGGILFYRLVIEEREKRKIKGSFRQYLSPKIIDVITKDPSKLKLGGEEREVSIFFLDIAGFTTMSEALRPTQLVEVMNQCLTEFSRIILKHEGLINKYIGDCIMAFWNAPADQPRHATQACLAALECIDALPGINRRFQEKGLPSIDCRVGVNTGVVVVGNMGSMERFDYTVMGDPVNLASRLEGANKQYHTRIMISDATWEKAKEDVEVRDLDLIRVKGKREPRKVYEVIAKKGELLEEFVEGRKRYHNALALYRQQNFEEAIAAFEEVFDYLPNDYVTRVYLERARAFLNRRPPAEWDGVFELTTK